MPSELLFLRRTNSIIPPTGNGKKKIIFRRSSFEKVAMKGLLEWMDHKNPRSCLRVSQITIKCISLVRLSDIRTILSDTERES